MARPGICKNVKFKRLVKTLDLPRPYVLGLLEVLWSVAYESGRPIIGNSEDIEIAAEWPGEPRELFEALRDGRWIDAIDGADDLWEIHDLLDNAPDYVRKRASRERLGKPKDLRSVSSADVRRTADSGRQRHPSPPGPSPPSPEEDPPSPPAGGTVSVEIPEILRASDFLAAWLDWIEYRKERRLAPYKPRGLKGALARLAKIGSERAAAAIRWSICQNYQGIHEEQSHGQSNVGNRPLTRVDAPPGKYKNLAKTRHVGGKDSKSPATDRETREPDQ